MKQLDEGIGDTLVSAGTPHAFKLQFWRTIRDITNSVQLYVAGILRLNHFPAKNSDIEVFRFFLIPHGEEMREKKPSYETGASESFMRASSEELEPKERIPRAPDIRSYSCRANR